MSGMHASKTTAAKINQLTPIGNTSPQKTTNNLSIPIHQPIHPKAAFPGSFDTIGSMPSESHITVDPDATPVQHGHREVSIELWDGIEAQIQKI